MSAPQLPATGTTPSFSTTADNGNAVRQYLGERFGEHLTTLQNWQTQSYGSAYLAFLRHRLLMSICINQLGMVFTSPTGLRSQTPSGHQFMANDVAEWAGIKARRFSEMRTNWKRAEETLMKLRQEVHGGGLGAGLNPHAQSDRNRLYKILDLMFQDNNKVFPPHTHLPPTAYWIRDVVTITMSELVRRIAEVGDSGAA